MNERKRYVILDPEGMVISQGIAAPAGLPPGALVLKGAAAADWIGAAYFDGAQMRPRPVGPALEPQGTAWVIRACPAGTRVKITDMSDGEVLADVAAEGDLDLALPDPGSYQIEILPPIPALPRLEVVKV